MVDEKNMTRIAATMTVLGLLAAGAGCTSPAPQENEAAANAVVVDLGQAANHAMGVASDVEARASQLGNRAAQAWRERRAPDEKGRDTEPHADTDEAGNAAASPPVHPQD